MTPKPESLYCKEGDHEAQEAVGSLRVQVQTTQALVRKDLPWRSTNTAAFASLAIFSENHDAQTNALPSSKRRRLRRQEYTCSDRRRLHSFTNRENPASLAPAVESVVNNPGQPGEESIHIRPVCPVFVWRLQRTAAGPSTSRKTCRHLPDLCQRFP